MSTLNVYWRAAGFVPEAQDKHQQKDVHTGVLTDEHDAATPEAPVLVEEVTRRVYTPGDLPPDTVLYVEDHPGELPAVAQKARRAGYAVEHALHDEGITDEPTAPRQDGEAESPVQPRDHTPPTE